MGDQVRVEKNGPVTTVILDRPEVRNAVDPATGRALVDAFGAFEDDDEARVAVFFGDHGAFCAGGDLKALYDDRGDTWLNKLHFHDDPEMPLPPGPLGPSRLELTKPTIATVAGPAVAGGMELALWCDVRVMEDDAYFGVYCRRWGIPLIDGGTVRLPRLVGQGRALEIILTGRTVPAQEALAIGMCEKVVPKGEARQAGEAMAREIARFPPECTRADRNSVHRQYGLPIRDALRQEYENGLACLENEGVAGAGRFAGGKGRHGDYGNI